MYKTKKKKTGISAGKESFSNILGESKYNALACTRRNPAGLESRPELDLPFCSYGNGMVRLRTGPISGSLFRTIRILKDRFAGFVSVPLCECNLSPTGFLERTGAYQYKIALMEVWRGVTLIGLLKPGLLKIGMLLRCDVKFSVFQIQLTSHLKFQHF